VDPVEENQEDLSPDDFKLCRNIAANDTCESMGWVRRVEPRRVWDAFPFFNEFRVLKLRLHTLAPVMHRFVLAEATRTFSNELKPLHFGERVLDDAELADFLPQIEHVVIDDMPTASHWPFDREHHQRNALVRGLAQASADDLILVSDCDEIPDPHAIELLRSCDGWDTTGPVRFYIRHYQWKFSFQFQTLKPHPQLATVEWLAGARARGSCSICDMLPRCPPTSAFTMLGGIYLFLPTPRESCAKCRPTPTTRTWRSLASTTARTMQLLLACAMP
jgi:hypothetical protein